MDHYPFEFNITIIGLDVQYFIDILIDAGFIEQAKIISEQFEKQMKDA